MASKCRGSDAAQPTQPAAPMQCGSAPFTPEERELLERHLGAAQALRPSISPVVPRPQSNPSTPPPGAGGHDFPGGDAEGAALATPPRAWHHAPQQPPEQWHSAAMSPPRGYSQGPCAAMQPMQPTQPIQPLGRSGSGDSYGSGPSDYAHGLHQWQHHADSASGITHVCVVQFKHGRVGEYRCTQPLQLGVHVLTEADRGEDLGMVTTSRPASPGDGLLPWVTRIATDREADFWRGGLAEEEHDARRLCQEILQRRGIPLNIVRAEFQFDMRKLTFHYTAEAAQPLFRDCLADCYAVWKCRIWFARIPDAVAQRQMVVRVGGGPRLYVLPRPQPQSSSKSAPLPPPLRWHADSDANYQQ
eukprot:TRINITY_DN9268_c0_g1_i1.p2 TRINITY_DN9268_c0_g1~~TRINITY_DN9268_c0_g1_i1.p2  ORF type:complete len:359 (+),score=77.36 TRINITY_DN9268_c0_g1_i1:82-1158(+)